MNDMLLVVTLPILMVLLAAIYKVIDLYIAAKDDCSHTWSRWSDPQKGDAHPYQTRSCNKCNMHQHRLVQ